MQKGIKYTDLHRHLDGSLRLETLLSLAEQQNIILPQNHKDIFFFQGMGLQAALSRFALTLSVLQHPDAVKQVAEEMCQDAINENVDILEIRFAPQLHKQAPMEEIVDAVLDGIKNRAGLILCGLYGEEPSLLERLVKIAIPRQGVVGIDLAGGPIPTHRYTMKDYAQAFEKAKKHGIGRTVHAGEGRPATEIRQAIEILHAQRIGHGTTLLADPQVVALLAERQIGIEACVTSNVQTAVIDSPQQHPIRTWLEHGISVSICTDNTLLSQIDAPTEYHVVSQIKGMTPASIQQCIQNGYNNRFQR